jgi:hypothetical protein
VGFVVDKVALGQVFSEYIGLPCQFSFYRLLHIHHLSSEAGTIGQLVADVPSGPSLTPPQETKLRKQLIVHNTGPISIFVTLIIRLCYALHKTSFKNKQYLLLDGGQVLSAVTEEYCLLECKEGSVFLYTPHVDSLQKVAQFKECLH